MHPLENIIWQALTTRQAEFAETFQSARRFMREVTSLAAMPDLSAQSFQSLAGLTGAGGTTALFLDDPFQPRPGWKVVAGAPMLEMVYENGTMPASPEIQLLELGAQDSPEMVELATLTKPGPFGIRTHELGTYLGIRREGKLVAMAGERLKIPGYTEVSAVCTNPDHTGKGYAQALMSEVMRRILDRGETPLLHVREDNERAVRIYEKLGFRTRVLMHFAVIRRDAAI
jgi:ribosomal protein S18 acetylase RimI-like enzyme